MKENFNAALIRAIRETTPSGENLANALMDILCIGKEAVYRRLRGEVTFTFEEAGIIAHHYSLSLDRITGTVSGGTNQFSLGIPLADNPMAAYTTLLKRYRDFFENVQNDPSAEVSSATNIIPFTFYCGYEYLSRFRLYRWMYQHQPLRTHVPLSQITVHQQLTDLHLQLGRSVRQAAHTTFILDGKLFESFINEIRYFSDLHLISNDEREKMLCELLLLLDELETLAAAGEFSPGKRLDIYLSHLDFEATYSLLVKTGFEMAFFRVYSINSLDSQDPSICTVQREWLQFLKRHSTLISQSGEIQRRQSFLRQRELAGRLQMEPA